MRIYKFEITALTGILLLIFVARTLSYPLGSLDEIWVYQYSRRLMLGQTPYVDFYILVFPLGLQINAALLSALGDQLLILRLIGIVVSVAVGVLVYSASRKLGTSPYMCVLPVSGVILAQHVCPYNSYTWFALLFLSAAMLVHLTEWQKFAKTRDQSSHSSWALVIVGFLLGLATLSKQNIGLAGLLSATVFVFVFGSQHQRSSYRIRITQTGSMLLGFVIPIAAELTYLGYQDALPAFFQNTVYDILIFQADANQSLLDRFSNPLVGLTLLTLVVAAPALSALAALLRPATDDMRVVLLVSPLRSWRVVCCLPSARSDASHVRRLSSSAWTRLLD